MRRSTFLSSIGPRTADEERQLVLSLVLRPGGVRPPLPKGYWPLSSDVLRGIGVGVLPVAALDTSERGLVGTVGACGMTTSETRLAGVTRVNKHHRDVKPSSFVLDFAHQVAERPACHHAVEAFASTGAIANAVQSLKHNDRVLVLRGDVPDLAADLMVQVGHPAAFFAALVFHPVNTPMMLVPSAHVGKVLAPVAGRLAIKENQAIRCGDSGMSHDAQINADERGFTATGGRRVGDANRQHHVPVAVSLKEFGVTVRQLNCLSIMGWNLQGEPDVLVPLAGRDTQHEAVVVSDHGVGIDPQANPLRSTDFGEGGSLPRFSQAIERAGQRYRSIDGHTGIIAWQTKLLSGGSVYNFVQLGSAAGLMFLSRIQTILDSLAKRLDCVFKPLRFVFGWLHKFDNNRFRTMHGYNIAQVFSKSKAEAPFIPMPEGRGFPTEMW